MRRLGVGFANDFGQQAVQFVHLLVDDVQPDVATECFGPLGLDPAFASVADRPCSTDCRTDSSVNSRECFLRDAISGYLAV
jgi:hypothetical protein